MKHSIFSALLIVSALFMSLIPLLPMTAQGMIKRQKLLK